MSEFFNSEKIKLKQPKENIPSPLLWVNQQGEANINCTPKVVADANIRTLTLVIVSKLLRLKGTSLFVLPIGLPKYKVVTYSESYIDLLQLKIRLYLPKSIKSYKYRQDTFSHTSYRTSYRNIIHS